MEVVCIFNTSMEKLWLLYSFPESWVKVPVSQNSFEWKILAPFLGLSWTKIVKHQAYQMLENHKNKYPINKNETTVYEE